jgi:hypothetical protein
VARLGEDARATEEEVETQFDLGAPGTEHPFSEDELIVVWELDGAAPTPWCPS